jgi:dihydrofolate reductase
MARLTLDISMSLDGFVAGPNQTLEQPLGEGGERLHEWAFAVVGFREMHGLPGGEAGAVFILTHHAREPVTKEGGTTFTFVTDGIEAALEQARAAAGDEDVAVGGGANVTQQYLKAGLLDELQIHVVPLLLGDGVRLFENHLTDAPGELECTRAIESPTGVTHLRHRVVK